MHAPHQILAVFAHSRRPLGRADAERIAGLIGDGSLDDAIGQASNDGAREALRDLLAYRQALCERHEPARLVRRLRDEADGLDWRCARLDATAAECFGKAAYRRRRGDDALGGEFIVRAEAAEATAAVLREQALAHRIDAAVIEARAQAALALTKVAVTG